ncbi:hypothetical protein BH23BAC1_BH23BAC1_02610 [soil metagenome]
MIKYFYLVLICLMPFLMSCAKRGVASKSKPATFKEDISQYRPVFELNEGETAMEEEPFEVGRPAATPVNDITFRLNNLLDSMQVRNSEQRLIQGYTVQVYSGNSREAANEAKSLVYKLFPESRPETTYVQPNYKVKVGKYLNRVEAQKLFAKLKSDFPGALVIPEKISLSRL